MKPVDLSREDLIGIIAVLRSALDDNTQSHIDEQDKLDAIDLLRNTDGITESVCFTNWHDLREKIFENPLFCHCGAPGKKMNDPYMEDVCNEEVETVLCDDCASEMCHDI